MVIDIERYGDPVRDDQTRMRLRGSLRRALRDALNKAGLSSPEHQSDTGDGWLVVLDADAKVSVLHAVTDSLPAALSAQGLGADPTEDLRVRVVVHAGEVLFDDDGTPVGMQVNRAFRMMEADPLRVCLRAARGPLVVGVSDYVYEQVVRQGHAGMDSSRFEPVRVQVKEEQGTVWVHAPGDPGVAARAGVAILNPAGGRAPALLVAHAPGDTAVASELAGQLRRAGYEVAHQGPILSGETLASEAAAVLAEGGPLVVCGTFRAIGSGWTHRLAQAVGQHPQGSILPVRMEQGAYVEMLGWGAAIAEWWQDQDRAVGTLCAALAERYPTSQAPTEAGSFHHEAEIRYRSLLLKNYDILDWAGLPQRDPTLITSKLELRRLYVALRVIVESSVDTGLDPERLEALEFDRDEQRGLWGFQRIPVGRRQTEEPVRVPIGERLEASRRVVVLGDPGSGKSTLLKWMATAYLLRAEDALDWRDLPDVETLPDADWLPIMIRCRDLDHDRPALAFDDALHQSLRNLVVRKDWCDQIHSFLLERLAAGKALLLIDGLDEINDPRARASFCEQVERVHLAYPDVPIIVTSRIVGYREMSRRIGRGFEHVKVADLDGKDKDEFARRWCNLTMPPARVEAATDGLIDDIHSTDRIERLTGNPLLLTTMALVRGTLGRLPNRRGELYAEAVSVLLNWRPDIGEPLTPSEALPQLEYIAYAMCERMVQRLRFDELVDLCVQMRTEFPNIHATGLHDPETFIRLVEERTGLLNETGYERHHGQLTGVYEFRHLTFQEYLAGVGLARGHFPGHQAGQPVSAAAAPLAAPVWSTPKDEDEEPRMVVPENWLEPVRLCATACNSSDVDPLLSAVLAPLHGEDGALTARPRAVLAALCLADEPDASSQVAEHVIQTLISQINDRDGGKHERSELDEAAVELVNSRWRDRFLNALIGTYLTLPSLDRIPVGAVYGRVVTDIGDPEDDPTRWTSEISAELRSGDSDLMTRAMLRAGGAAKQTKAVRAYRSFGLTDQLLHQCMTGTPTADAAAWALSRLADVREPTSPSLPLSSGPSPTGWYLTPDELQILGEIIGGSEAISDAALVCLLGIARTERIRSARPRALAGLEHIDRRVRAASATTLGALQHLASGPTLSRHLLEDPSSEVRTAAARALGWLEDLAAVPALADALSDIERTVRAAAADALGVLGAQSSCSLLRSAASDPDTQVRASVAQALGRLRDPEAMEVVATLLHDSDVKVRSSAAMALSWLDRPSVGVALTCLDDEDSRVRQRAIQILHNTGYLFDDAAVVNRVLALATDSAASVRSVAVRALGELREPRLAQAFIDRVADDKPSVRAVALDALGWLGDPAFRAEAIPQLEHDHHTVVSAAVDALIGMGVLDLDDQLADVIKRKPSRGLCLAASGIPRAFLGPLGSVDMRRPAVANALRRCGSSQDEELRDAAILALCALGDADYIGDLVQLAGEADSQTLQDLHRCLLALTGDHALLVLKRLSRAESPYIRYWAADCLGRLRQESAFASLSLLLDDPYDSVRAIAAYGLDQLPATPEIADTLIRHFDDPYPWARLLIAQALLDCEGEPVALALISRRDDPSRKVRRSIMHALGGRPHQLVVPILLEALEDEDGDTRSAAAWSLGRTEQEQSTIDRFIAMLAEAETDSRITAITALPLRQHADLAELVLPYLDDPNEGLQKAAFNRLWLERHPMVVERLNTSLRSSNGQRRKQAVQELAWARDELDRRLLSGDLSGHTPFRDPLSPVTLGEVRIAASRLRLKEADIKLGYEALAEELPLRLAWRPSRDPPSSSRL